MFHQPILINNLDLSFANKICFHNFSTHINYGDRIAIIGHNGCGKSSLIKMLYATLPSMNGDISVPENIIKGYVPQIIDTHENLSGGQRFNQALTQTLVINPNLLLLDEPTNHLDQRNRKNLTRLLKNYPGTLIIASHDTQLLNQCIDILWHIDQGEVKVFKGRYDNYMAKIDAQRTVIESELTQLQRQKQDMHHKLMKEQQRSAQSRSKGQKNVQQQKWPTLIAKSKAGKAEQTAGSNKSAINQKKHHLNQQLNDLYTPEIIMPKFSLTSDGIGNHILLSITEGTIAYNPLSPIIHNINLSLNTGGRIAIMGDNGCGKSTLVKAILGDDRIIKTGIWHQPRKDNIGYLDQHYNTLNPQQTVIASLTSLVPTWSHVEIRSFLNDFLFRKNDEVNAVINQLSGGEKARLCLTHIAAQSPKLLILDEITNNLDIQTRQHVIDVLKNYPGAMIVISHDTAFLQHIGIVDTYIIKNNNIKHHHIDHEIQKNIL